MPEAPTPPTTIEGPPRHDLTAGRIAWTEVRAEAPSTRRCEADVVLTFIHAKVADAIAAIAESSREGPLPGHVATLLKAVASKGVDGASAELSALRSGMFAWLFNKKNIPWANQMTVSLSVRGERREDWK